MAPVAVAASAPTVTDLKKEETTFNPFYSPNIADDGNDQYEYAKYKPTFPNIKWEPLKEVEVSDRGLHADPEKKSLFSAAQEVKHLTPAIGTELVGIDLRQLTNTQKDELALLVAERGAVCT